MALIAYFMIGFPFYIIGKKIREDIERSRRAKGKRKTDVKGKISHLESKAENIRCKTTGNLSIQSQDRHSKPEQAEANQSRAEMLRRLYEEKLRIDG